MGKTVSGEIDGYTRGSVVQALLWEALETNLGASEADVVRSCMISLSMCSSSPAASQRGETLEVRGPLCSAILIPRAAPGKGYKYVFKFVRDCIWC